MFDCSNYSRRPLSAIVAAPTPARVGHPSRLERAHVLGYSGRGARQQRPPSSQFVRQRLLHHPTAIGSLAQTAASSPLALRSSTARQAASRCNDPSSALCPTKDDGGYWLDASDGGVFSFGDTQFYGSIPGLGLHPAGSGLPNSLNAPIVGMVPSNDDDGYFMVASDGGVFAFGDAHFAGSCPGIGGCSGAAVAVMPDASGNGYWLVTQTGSVYTFGDATYYGAPGNTGSPVTSAVRTPNGGGYWILTANGTVYNYGNAGNYGDASRSFRWPEPSGSDLHHIGRWWLLDRLSQRDGGPVR